MSLDNIFEKAKDIFEAAYRKTENVVSHQKQKLDVQSLESKLNKNYETLGKAYYGMLNSGEDFDSEALKPILDEIKENLLAVNAAKEELMKYQNKRRCKACGEIIDNNSQFCNRCGKKVE